MSDPTEIRGRTAARVPGPAMAERYGTAGRRRRGVALALGGLLAVALLGWAVWAPRAQDEPPIDATVTSYDVVDSHEIRVKVDARFRDDGADGTCLVRATAEDHTVVGEENLTADELRAAEGQWIPVRTERRATTAELVRCTD